MRTDKKTGAPQFTLKDLVNCGTRLPPKYSDNSAPVVGVTVDDVNLWLRAFYLRKRKAKP